MLDCLFVIYSNQIQMHNFVRPIVAIDEALSAVGKKLHSPKKDFFANNRNTLATLYHNYDIAAENDQLHLLQPHFSNNSDRQLAYGLYESDRPFVNNHWEAVRQMNGGETIYCPICGLKECEEMDHFVPREVGKYPEYSAHLSNLIPLCHYCNHKKSTAFLDDEGNRIFFNAYFDVMPRRDILVCYVQTSPLDGMPQIRSEVNPSLNPANKPDQYILSTITKLELLPKFHSKAKLYFKREIGRLSNRLGQDWDAIKLEIQPLTVIDDDPDIVYHAVLKAIIESPIVETWYQSLS